MRGSDKSEALVGGHLLPRLPPTGINQYWGYIRISLELLPLLGLLPIHDLLWNWELIAQTATIIIRGGLSLLSLSLCPSLSVQPLKIQAISAEYIYSASI